jgi:hypothetical protein
MVAKIVMPTVVAPSSEGFGSHFLWILPYWRTADDEARQNATLKNCGHAELSAKVASWNKLPAGSGPPPGYDEVVAKLNRCIEAGRETNIRIAGEKAAKAGIALALATGLGIYLATRKKR